MRARRRKRRNHLFAVNGELENSACSLESECFGSQFVMEKKHRRNLRLSTWRWRILGAAERMITVFVSAEKLPCSKKHWKKSQ